MLKTVCLTSLVLVSGLAATEISEKIAKRLESSEAAYQAAVQKADNARFYAIQKASQDRVKALKSALTEATKSGDFDSATELKARITAAEAAGGVRQKPKDTVKFGGHEYALIKDPVTWHTAKRRCEEMGGHLATIESQAENDGLLALCRASKQCVWIGATDEAVEGTWAWLNGTPVTIAFNHDNAGDAEHCLTFHFELNRWEDGPAGARFA